MNGKGDVIKENILDDIGNVIWDNEIIKISYLGIHKGIDCWKFKFLLENKKSYKVSIGVSDFIIENQVINVFPYIKFDLGSGKKIGHISVEFDMINDFNIMSVNDFSNIYLRLFLVKSKKKVEQSPQIMLRPTEFNKIIHEQMQYLITNIEKGLVWDDKVDEFPPFIEFEFLYPNGKHGDIDLYLISQYGMFEQVSPISFKAILSTEKLDIIEFMVLFYYNRFSQNALLVNRNNNEVAVMFLYKYNNIMKLNEIYEIVSHEMNHLEILNNLVMQKCYNIIKNKYLELKNERNKIYANIVSNNESTSKWKSEQQLYAIVRKNYKDAIYQYHAEWLGRQSLDVYIPSLKVAIEYQGRQHYEPIDIFGGNDALKIRKIRDRKKKLLCVEKNIKLIEWKYDVVINAKNLKKLLDKNCNY